MKNEFLGLSRFRVGEAYSRADIAEMGSVSPRNFSWPTGITEFANAVLLFVTLEKTRYSYHDQFDGDLFWWQSQTRQTQEHPTLRRLSSGECPAHLFVRVREKDPGTLPFVYCGQLSPPTMEGERPVTCLFEVLDLVQDPPSELARVYAWRPTSPMEPNEVARRRSILETELINPSSRGQGRMRDYQRRRTIENHAMSIAKRHYSHLGYEVIDTSSVSPFDLSCTKDRVEKRVEVKGTQSSGATVDVTIGEVLSARNGPEGGYSTDLFVVHSILLTSIGGSLTASGGEILKVENWYPHSDQLQPIAFRHQVMTQAKSELSPQSGE